ncbi:type 1 glutamine amidotransferase [bacterium]|nr:type 1 glutamine amidotransferase [bacterium]
MKTSSRPILIVQHAPHEHPAALRRVLATQGIPTQWIHPYRGDPYPSSEDIAGVVSLGGPMSSNDESEHPWIKQELKLLQKTFQSGLPILGICLGGQLLARALGKRVITNPVAEVGWFPLELTPEGLKDRILPSASENPTVYHYHFETFEIPDGAQCLAKSGGCERQAYKLNDQTYGLQFHPEADHQLLSEWMSFDDFDEEIRDIQRKFGNKTVQSPDTQLSLATEAELNSIPLITAFSTLFRPLHSHQNSSRDGLHNAVRSWREIRIPVQTEVTGADGLPIQLRGVIERTFLLGGHEFLILRGEDQLVWPIRLDDLRNITPISK